MSSKPDSEGVAVPERRKRREALIGTVVQDETGGEKGGGNSQEGERCGKPAATKSEEQKAPNAGLREDDSAIGESFRGADGASPAKLMVPDAAPGGLAQRCLDRQLGEDSAFTKGCDATTELVVISDVVAKGFEAASCGEVRCPESERGTKTEFADTEELGNKGAGHEVGRDAEGLPGGGCGVSFGAVEARDYSDCRIGERACDNVQVVRGDKNVAVIHDPDGVAGVVTESSKKTHFSIREVGISDMEVDGGFGILGLQITDLVGGRIVGIGDTEENFKFRSGLADLGKERGTSIGIKAAQGLQDRDSGDGRGDRGGMAA